MEKTTPDLLQEFEQNIDLTPVSPGLRFANYIIDVIAFYALSFIVGMLYAVTLSSAYTYRVSAGDPSAIQFYLLFAWILIIIIYYTLFEFFAKGRTLGKMATGTMAIREDGGNLTFTDAFLRTLCRFIPFEIFSAFGYRPWHDSLTGTLVIKKPKKF
jgi:uncharacterized RDD family membrane protein YckC